MSGIKLTVQSSVYESYTELCTVNFIPDKSPSALQIATLLLVIQYEPKVRRYSGKRSSVPIRCMLSTAGVLDSDGDIVPDEFLASCTLTDQSTTTGAEMLDSESSDE